MNEMQKLLKEWSEIEPAKINYTSDGHHYSLTTFPNVLVLEIRDWHLPIIQGAVQQAIEARGWDWCLSVGNDEYLGDVYTKKGNSKPEDQYSIFAMSAAHALLESYLQALKSASAEVQDDN